MSTTSRRLLSLTLCYQLLLTFSVMSQNQTPAAPQKLSLTAALVLTPEFCATVSKKGHEKFPVGKAACTELEPVLKGVFASLTRVDDSSKAGDAQVVLEPKFADVGTTQKAFAAFAKRELVVLVDWTIRDHSGRVVWIDTVQGAVERRNLKHIAKDSVQDMAEQSATKMCSSPELLKLSAASVK